MNIKQNLRLLLEQGKVRLTKHAQLRDPPSGKYPLTRREIEKVLENGIITEGPTPDILTGGMKFKISRLNRPTHEVVAVIVPDKYILVITAYDSD